MRFEPLPPAHIQGTERPATTQVRRGCAVVVFPKRCLSESAKGSSPFPRDRSRHRAGGQNTRQDMSPEAPVAKAR